MSSYTPPSKRNKTSAPLSESKSIIVLDDDDQRFESVIRASRSPLYLSPIGKEIVRESKNSSKPLNLEKVNQAVLMKEFARQLGQHTDSENKEDEDEIEETKNNDNSKNDEDSKKSNKKPKSQKNKENNKKFGRVVK